MPAVDDLNIASERILVTPEALKLRLSLSDDIQEHVACSRKTIRNILEGVDHRLMVVVGPCSIHDPAAAIDYANKLVRLAHKLDDTLFLVMRVYFEKPRTTVGWKGLINDPYLDGSFRIDDGLDIARRLLLDIAALGLPAATEALDPISPQYLQDLISWTAIGARTTESQTHREMASGLSSPVGFKNGTDGSLAVAVNAITSSAREHGFLGINAAGRVAVIRTRGNRVAHVVLRGGDGRPNYDSVNVALCEKLLEDEGLAPNIVIDCSHANARKNHELQPLVIQDVAKQILDGNRSIKGLMIESNLHAGAQALAQDGGQLRYGVSVTDPCIGWETTEHCLHSLREKLRYVLPGRTRLDRAAS